MVRLKGLSGGFLVFRAIAISLSMLAAVALAFGAQFQNDSVIKNSAKKSGEKLGVGFKSLIKLVRNPRWLIGMSFLGGGAILQIAALTMAPLIVVQPIGALALVITALLNARSTKTAITRATWAAIGVSTAGIVVFVTLAAQIADDERKLTDSDIQMLLGVIAVVLVLFMALFVATRKKATALNYILGAGILYGFAITFIKAVIQRVAQDNFDALTLTCVFAAIGAIAVGAWFVQNAYASGPPDLVIAGLTVIDPMVAITIGMVILGEASRALPLDMTIFIVSGATAALGVYMLSKVHPELKKAK
jgi:drug/metabolite transporter (DMT)-like permease